MTNGFSSEVDPMLLVRAQAGDMNAHADLFRQFGAAVFTLARRLVRRPDVAEEILQETFLDVMRRIGGYRGEAPIGFWIRRIAVNRSLMFLRSYWEQQGEALEAEIIDDGSNFDIALGRVDLAGLLDRLPAIGRAVLWLHDVEGYTHQEIAQLTGKTASFSKSQLARSHLRLRRMVMEGSTEEVKQCMPKPIN